ncbi:PucR family transcriptional regulator [Aquibacillus kalidii]|uniref:PucR family transcriptional regulator n=1 Tax=Aquibacillus kalidii TaxID=2762597 RepID=UPI001647127E|nr:helix-turn-helix domain-containing protein [Aquibacillus kalidii]
MIEKLKQIYPSLIEIQSDSDVDTDQYVWYITSTHHIVGIHKSELSDKENNLLETFLSPYYTNQAPITNREKEWLNVIYNGGDQTKFKTEEILNYRFIYFSLSDDTVDPISFREAVHGLFPSKVPILWENNHEGVIIQENWKSSDESISYLEIIDVLTSDFYMNVHLFEGPIFYDTNSAAHHYEWIKKCFRTVLPYSKGKFSNYVSSLPYLLINHFDESYVETLIDSILKETKTEEELLNTIHVFLECNSNATLAAKKLYMHRNSLQYRVDKFIEKTGIDVKQFEGAIAVYLTLILRNKRAKEKSM